ncbi:transcription factor bHLH112-like isoform X2 [Abrus precatorius]|uniref:Transcription factor bHLH112-like isoform X2 n=1 Tax=Abrus precatorius TaxID=3816 RepID=A0A8B8JML7_ABRPR|nr:transcription factor bHLH112-like isoform X2 [Abrus precatorius]
MAEEFQAAAVCGENWWNINSARSVFPLMMSSSSTCSVAAADAGNYSTWQTDFMDLKGASNNLVSDSFLGFLDAEKAQKSDSASGTGSILIDSPLQMMGFGMSSSTSSNWNQSLLQESSFHSVFQEETGMGGNNSQIQNDWSPKNFSSDGGSQVSTVDAYKPMNQEFSLDQQSLNSVTSTGLSGGFPVGSASYGYPSTLIQSLFDPKPQPQPQNSLFTNPTMSYSSTTNYGTCSNEPSPTWSKVSSLLKPSMPKQQLSGLHFSNNTPFWNASAEALNDLRAGVFASSQAQYQTPKFEEKPNCPNTQLNKLKREESPDTTSATKKNSSEPAFKRPRIETPSPLPTFKVRKEKLGDRITALQQLVSPFGKTDTASVLHEAIEYIKFLHDQVSVLSTPYMKNGAPVQQQQGCDNLMDSEGPRQDLRSRGLCLVPISSTFPVANETTVDFWTPTFGGTLIGR